MGRRAKNVLNIFLNLEKQRSNSNTLFSVQRKDNPLRFASNPLDILEEIKNHFSEIYSIPSQDTEYRVRRFVAERFYFHF